MDAYAARLALSVNIAQAYVELQRAYLQLDVAEKALAEREQIYKLTQERFDAGIDSRLAVKQAESALPATRETIAQLNEVIGLTRNQLAALLGQGPDRGLAIARPDGHRADARSSCPRTCRRSCSAAAPTSSRSAGASKRRRKDIDVAKARVLSQREPDRVRRPAEHRAARGSSTPAAARSASGPAVTLPIFDAGRLRGQLAGNQADYDVGGRALQRGAGDGLHDVVDQLTSFRSLEEQTQAAGARPGTAQEAFDLALLRFREGVGNYLEVLTAESQLLAQQSLDADLRARELSLTIRLVRRWAAVSKRRQCSWEASRTST